MNVWKCYSCQKRFSVTTPDMHCPNCKRLVQWVLVSVLPAGLPEGHVQETEEMQEMKGRYEIRQQLGIKGSSRPCKVPTCAGKMYAYLYLYKDGGFRLIFSCDRCHSDFLPGLGSASTNESEPPAVVTALV